jgi:hypothetical protein
LIIAGKITHNNHDIAAPYRKPAEFGVQPSKATKAGPLARSPSNPGRVSPAGAQRSRFRVQAGIRAVSRRQMNASGGPFSSPYRAYDFSCAALCSGTSEGAPVNGSRF